MGTNFYLQYPATNHCTCCGREDEGERLHIGKSSAGWVFALRVYPGRGINDWPDWQAIFDAGVITDEYGDTLTKTELLMRITERKGRAWDEQRWPNAAYNSEEHMHRANDSERGPNGLLRARLGPHCKKHGTGTWDCHEGDFS